MGWAAKYSVRGVYIKIPEGIEWCQFENLESFIAKQITPTDFMFAISNAMPITSLSIVFEKIQSTKLYEIYLDFDGIARPQYTGKMARVGIYKIITFDNRDDAMMFKLIYS